LLQCPPRVRREPKETADRREILILSFAITLREAVGSWVIYRRLPQRTDVKLVPPTTQPEVTSRVF